MRRIHNLFDFLALLFGVRTRKNTEGFKGYRLNLRRIPFPVVRVALLVVVVGTVLLVLLRLLTDPYVKERNTAHKLSRLSSRITHVHQRQALLPLTLTDVVANDPNIRNNTIDSWGNPVMYQPHQNNQGFTLVSAGRDQQLNTQDDIIERRNGHVSIR